MRLRCSSLLLLLLAGLLSACGDCAGTSSELELLAPDVSVTPDALAFGELWEGQRVVRQVTLRNAGEVDTRVWQIIIEGDGFELASPAPRILSARSELSFGVVAEGLVGSSDGQLTVRIDDAEGQLVAVLPLSVSVSPMPDCSDGNPCTDDHFDTDGERCLHDVNTGPCDDPCLEGGTCIDGRCVGQAVVCPGETDCGIGVCTPGVGCGVALNDALCDDGDPCTDDVCTAQGCGSTTLPEGAVCGPAVGCEALHVCTGGVCTAYPVPDGFPCELGSACTVGNCQAGDCVEVPVASVPSLVDVAEGFGGPTASLALLGNDYAVVGDPIGNGQMRLTWIYTPVAHVSPDDRTVIDVEDSLQTPQLKAAGERFYIDEGAEVRTLYGPLLTDPPVSLAPIDSGHHVFALVGAGPWTVACVWGESDEVAVHLLRDGELEPKLAETTGCARGVAVDAERDELYVYDGAKVNRFRLGPDAPELIGEQVMDAYGLVVGGDTLLIKTSAGDDGGEPGAGTWQIWDLGELGPTYRAAINTTAMPIVVAGAVLHTSNDGVVRRPLVGDGAPTWEPLYGLWPSQAASALLTDGHLVAQVAEGGWAGPMLYRTIGADFTLLHPPGMGEMQRFIGALSTYAWVVGPTGDHFVATGLGALTIDASVRFLAPRNEDMTIRINDLEDGIDAAVVGPGAGLGRGTVGNALYLEDPVSGGVNLGMAFNNVVEARGHTLAQVVEEPFEGTFLRVWDLSASLPLQSMRAVLLDNEVLFDLERRVLAISDEGDIAVFLPEVGVLIVDVSPDALTVVDTLPLADVTSLALSDDLVATGHGPLGTVAVWPRPAGQPLGGASELGLPAPKVLAIFDGFVVVDTADGLAYIDANQSPPDLVATVPLSGEITDLMIHEGLLYGLTARDVLTIDPPCPPP